MDVSVEITWRLGLIEVAYDTSKFDVMRDLCLQILSWEENGCARFWSAVITLEKENVEAAIPLFAYALPLLQEDQDASCFAMANLGWIYSRDKETIIGVETNNTLAFHYFQEASARGLLRAQTYLAQMYWEGRGTMQDIDRAEKILCLVVQSGYLSGMHLLAKFTLFTRGNAEKGLQLYEMCARKGHPRALRELGCYYSNGYGVPLNKQKAIEYYTEASNLGVSEAQNDLGWIYVTGDGIEQDIQKGIELYRLSASQGNRDAEYNLAYLYETKGIPGKGPVDALALYRFSWKKGNVRACQALGRMYFTGLGVKEDKFKAIKLWRKILNMPEIPTVQYDMGCLYWTGDISCGIEMDYGQAVRLFRKSALQDHEPAISVLENLLYLNIMDEEGYT